MWCSGMFQFPGTNWLPDRLKIRLHRARNNSDAASLPHGVRFQGTCA